jgi:multicomponent Na+:H+ antiporter subunit E
MKGSKILLFTLCLVMWFLLSWSFSGKSVIAGVLISLAIAFVIEGDLFTKNPHKMTHMKRYMWFFVYSAVLSWDMLKANIEVLFYLLTPKMKLDPVTEGVPTELKSETGITALANTITLIQGMSTVDIDEETRTLHVHFLRSSQKDALTAKIRKYERILKDVYEE